MFTLSVVGPEFSLGDCCGMGGVEAGESFRPPTNQKSCNSSPAYSLWMEEFMEAEFDTHYWKF